MKWITSILTGIAIILAMTAGSEFAQAGGGQLKEGNDAGTTLSGASLKSHGSTPGPSIEPTIEKVKPEEVLEKNPKLSSKVQGLLPPGYNLLQAASGFKDVKEFVAAVHASKNLGISLSDLKAKILKGASLGKAIKELKPDADSKEEAKRAQKAAKDDIKETKT